MTGSRDRPSAGAPETRKAATLETDPGRQLRKFACAIRTVTRALHDAERNRLKGLHSLERRQQMANAFGALAADNSAAIAGVTQRYRAMRAAITTTDPTARAAELGRIAAEEQAEVLRLTLAHAEARGRARRSVNQQLLPLQRERRRRLSLSQRHAQAHSALRVQQMIAANRRRRNPHARVRVPPSLITR